MKKVYLRQIFFLRYALMASFAAVIISDLAECQPIGKLWQVLPDPGPQCRQGFAQMLTMGISSAVIDVILIAFPVPIVLSTRIPTKRKVLLVLLFFFGFVTVGITVYRIPNIIQSHGDQVYRSMWASIELFAATIVANLVALGSFLRDSGAKKQKFRHDYGSSGNTSSHRQGPILTGEWDDTKANGKGQYNDWNDRTVASELLAAKDVESNSHTSSPGAERGHSPTDSQHSLLHRHSMNTATTQTRLPGEVEGQQQSLATPDRVLVAGRSGLHRR